MRARSPWPGPKRRKPANEPRQRLAAGLFGRRAEQLAILFLRTKGYRVVARTYGVRGGEIDIIAWRGRAVVFVEVKARPKLEDALIAITPAKTRTHVRCRAALARRK